MILCSSGVFFHPDGAVVDAILALGPRLPVDGIEVLVTRRMVETLRDAADRLGACPLRLPVIHAPKRVGAALPAEQTVAQLQETAWFATRIGATLVVLHLWDLPESD